MESGAFYVEVPEATSDIHDGNSLRWIGDVLTGDPTRGEPG